jgi:hypothetical protein
MATPKTATRMCELIPLSISPASAMPLRSAAMLIVLAMSSAAEAATTRGFGKRLHNAPASPSPVTMPMRAHIICTAAISGQVSQAVHSNEVPSCAPATE